MPLFPHVQRATNDLVEKLKSVRKSNACAIDLSVVVATLDTTSMEGHDAQAIVKFEGFDVDEDNSPMQHTDSVLAFSIAVAVRDSETSEVSCHDRVLIAAAEVERALLADVSRTGEAQDTVLIGGQVIDARAEMSLYAIDLNYQVRVRYAIAQPFPTT